MSHGYNGKILHVNLTSGEISVEEPGVAFYRRYRGGSALAMHYILKEVPPGADPLGPDNVLVLALSVLTGAAISGQSRITAAAKSPLTGAIGDSQGGGFFPAELKFAGFDAIVIKGKAEKPVYLWINEGNYELRDASHLWGKITLPTLKLERTQPNSASLPPATWLPVCLPRKNAREFWPQPSTGPNYRLPQSPSSPQPLRATFPRSWCR